MFPLMLLHCILYNYELSSLFRTFLQALAEALTINASIKQMALRMVPESGEV